MLLLIVLAFYGGASTATPTNATPSSNDDRLSHSIRPRPFLSPMGEPFLPTPEAPDGLQRWFGQADADHDGVLTVAELQRDSARFFRSLDVHHDGEIDPEDIDRYENEIAPQVQVAAMSQSRDGPHGAGGSAHRDWGGHHRGGDNGRDRVGGRSGSRLEGAARYSLLDIPEPVASADANFNRGVSSAEFEHAAGQRFLLLDADHDGRLTLPELQTIARATAAASRHPRHEHHSSASDSFGGRPGEVGDGAPGGDFPN
jgi:Ca2+-binding EF-hand superfamily protein